LPHEEQNLKLSEFFSPQNEQNITQSFPLSLFM
jgi:hypothetical protein